MSSNSSNISKILNDGLLNIDAWHEEFTGEVKEAKLYVHANFGTAKMGGDGESSITFKLRLRRATLVVLVPTEEGFKVDPKSVVRENPAKFNTEISAVETREITGKAGVSIGQTNNLNLSANADGKRSVSNTVNGQSETFAIQVKDSKYRQHHCWLLEPLHGDFLASPPWVATDEPRLTILDKRDDKKRNSDLEHNMTAPVIIEVRCLKEDLDIELQPTDAKIRNWIKMQPQGEMDKRLAAAECFIRDELIKKGLDSVELSGGNRYLNIRLCRVVAEVN